MERVNKKTIIRTLEKIALYMELQGENPFKISAFRKAAGALETDVRSMSEIDDITKIKGIGKGTAAVIEDVMNTGQSSLLVELEQQVPQGLLPLIKIPGLGGKKLAKLYSELHVTDRESLLLACENKQVQTLAGFGAKTEEKIKKELLAFGSRPDRIAIWQLEPIVREMETILSSIKDVSQFSVAGSYRRTAEMSKDLDFIIATEKPETVIQELLAQLAVLEIIAQGETKVSLVLDVEEPVNIDFRFVPQASYATALHHFTGSKDHNVAMRQLAKATGQKISEYGVEQQDGTLLTFASERDFFAHFCVPYIPPTVRETGEELERTDDIAHLVQLEDIVADLHLHTTWSDGAHSVSEMGQALIKKGYAYGVITDHSQFLKVANGLTPERLRKQREEIDAFNTAHPAFRLFSGTEMDILPDATLDFSDDVLRELDFVIASIHSSFTQSEEKIMERLYCAVTNPYVHMIAHPTGRIIGQREGYQANIPQLIQWAAEYGKILELNASPFRLDLRLEHLKLAMEYNVPIAINTDAHATTQLEVMATGINYAQKAWLKKELIVNTWSRDQFEAWINRNK